MERLKEKRVVMVYQGYRQTKEERFVVASEIEGCIKAAKSKCIAFYFENAEYIEDRGERFYGKVEREPQTFYLGASHVTIAELEQLENSNIHHQRLLREARYQNWKHMLYCVRSTCMCLVEYVEGITIPVNEDGSIVVQCN